jgi:hypothetical protein
VKEQIISLDSNDDLNSLRDKMSRAQSSRILLCWPTARGALHRRLDMELARRWAHMVGSEIVIVSSDPTVQQAAESARLPWFRNESSAATASSRAIRRTLRVPWVPPSPRSDDILLPRNSLPRSAAPSQWPMGRRLAVGLFAVFSLALIPLLIYPSVEVHASYPARPITGSAALDTSQASRINISLETTGRLLTSGRASAPATFATGSIQLTNAGNAVLHLPAGLIVSDMFGVSFETMDGVTLNPGTSAMIAIRARRPGSTANLPARRINRMEGELALVLQVSNPAPTIGGGEIQRGLVTSADLEALQRRLTTDMRKMAIEGLTAAAGDDRLLAEASVQITIDRNSVADAIAGSLADSVGQTLSATANGLAFSRADLEAASSFILHAALEPGEKLAGTGLIYKIEPANAGGWRLIVNGRAYAAPDPQSVSSALRWQTVPAAQSILRNRFGATENPSIKINPSWWPWLPLFPFRIHLEMSPVAN